ncbi:MULTISPECIES: KAP family P-loop NTPase fold protein [unclassified Mesorhizobium]|uniref:KAP family P-loop NTPase fold protein n=1 Tax=unclassified Mesorhizobium TaxID=325217 RepID=UPI0019293F4E|nr:MULTISPECIES: P-loop NTPase fold protein [unclassified Mesorhizobium]BCG97244.1 phage T7 exclusion protein [Mesorhizobium sp. 131-2-1]BCH04314.1 phage T7 exclusion protein [Mesorhizobium sp. 131-2-5]
MKRTDHSVRGDRALSAGDDDKLGFREVAKRIAVSLVDRASEDGLVVGLEGAWGSGKTSLLYLVGEELENLPLSRRPTVIHFRPWLIGNRDALISSLFTELSNQLDQAALAAGDATKISIRKAKEAGEALQAFLSGLSKAGGLVEFVGDITGVGPLKYAGTGIKVVGDAVAGKKAPPQLASLKDKLAKSLRDLGHRFVVTIDDIDRLEPAEILETLRLVKSVIDLPNMIYLLCYDSEVLAHSVQEAASVQDGGAFLEKIVQLTVMVPKPEAFQLRQWFAEELQQIASVKDDDERERLRQVIDYEGGRRLRTPRSVVRTLDAIRFFWPPLRDIHADLADLVWLQLIKDGNPSLYRWIEAYCGSAAAMSLGTARIEDAEKNLQSASLETAAGKSAFDDHMYRHVFASQLPGLTPSFAKDDSPFQLFEKVDDRKRDIAIRKRRLASPDHYRLYFAMASPSHALTQADFDAMWQALASGPQEASALLLALHAQKAAGLLSKCDLIVERIKGGAYETLDVPQSRNLLLALGDSMDEAFRLRPFDGFAFNSLWDRTLPLIRLASTRLKPAVRDRTTNEMFESSRAIGWLTFVFRREVFAHGRYGDQDRPAGDWLLVSERQMDAAMRIMLKRYKAMSVDEILQSHSPLSLLYAWLQAGDENGPRKRLATHVKSNEGFLQVLKGLTSQINSSDRGTFDVLKKRDIESFLDFEEVTSRLTILVSKPKFKKSATEMLELIEDGDRY